MQVIKSDWQTIKDNYSLGWRLYHNINRDNITPRLEVYCLEHTGVVCFKTLINADSDDYTEFMNKYKSASNLSNTSIEGKVNTYSSPRPQGTSTYYCGVDDDANDLTAIGSGLDLYFKHNIGEPLSQNFIRNFNVIQNKTYIHDAVINWSNANGGKLTGQIVSDVSATVAGTNTLYQIYGDIILPSAGTGNVDVTAPKLVQSPVDLIGNRPPSFWDADWNSQTKTFDNIRANSLGLGEYNMFHTETVLKQFINKIHMMGDGRLRFNSKDIERIYHGMKFKFILETDGSVADHSWQVDMMLFLYREKTL